MDYVLVNDDKQGMCSLDSPSPQQLWLAPMRAVPNKISNLRKIAITSALFGYMLEQARLLAKANSEEEYHVCIESEPDEVCLRFGGSAVADLFNMRYMAMKFEKPSLHKEKVS